MMPNAEVKRESLPGLVRLTVMLGHARPKRGNVSKQSEARVRQGYVAKVLPMVCSNCKHYESKVTTREGVLGGVWHDESEKRCGLGGFAVKKMGGCNEHRYSGA